MTALAIFIGGIVAGVFGLSIIAVFIGARLADERGRAEGRAYLNPTGDE